MLIGVLIVHLLHLESGHRNRIYWLLYPQQGMCFSWYWMICKSCPINPLLSWWCSFASRHCTVCVADLTWFTSFWNQCTCAFLSMQGVEFCVYCSFYHLVTRLLKISNKSIYHNSEVGDHKDKGTQWLFNSNCFFPGRQEMSVISFFFFWITTKTFNILGQFILYENYNNLKLNWAT